MILIQFLNTPFKQKDLDKSNFEYRVELQKSDKCELSSTNAYYFAKITNVKNRIVKCAINKIDQKASLKAFAPPIYSLLS
jgi:hypothetical protein